MIKLVTNIEDANCITHSGTMHADEVFATAFLDLYLEDIKVARVPEVSKNLNSNAIIYDIGRGNFDHHQEDALIRDNGIKYSSFGLLWREFGKKYLEKNNISNVEEVFIAFDKELVEGIDAVDNGIFPEITAPYKVKTISEIIKVFNPSIFTNEDETEQFIKAVSFAKEIFIETLYNVIGKIKAKVIVDEIINKTEGKVLELEEYMPYEEAILTNEKANNILLVIYPSNRGGYAVKTISKSLEDKTDRLLLPEEWAGLSGDELEKVSGVKGANFCHIGRFIATCKTRDAILELVKKAIDNEQQPSV